MLPGNFLHDLIMTGSGQFRDLGSFGRVVNARECPQALSPAPWVVSVRVSCWESVIQFTWDLFLFNLSGFPFFLSHKYVHAGLVCFFFLQKSQVNLSGLHLLPFSCFLAQLKHFPSDANWFKCS